MNKSITLILFAAMVLAQWAVPVSMITKREMTLSQGAIYKFRCEPIDPYDAFRGKYVWLSVAPEGNATWNGEPLRKDQAIFVVLDQDEEGFANVRELQLTRPESGDYVKAKVRWNASGREDVPLEYPFDRYYLEESKAPRAETAYRQSLSDQQHNTYIAVRLRNGFGVIEELYIDDMPIHDFLEQQSRAESAPPDQVDQTPQ